MKNFKNYIALIILFLGLNNVLTAQTYLETDLTNNCFQMQIHPLVSWNKVCLFVTVSSSHDNTLVHVDSGSKHEELMGNSSTSSKTFKWCFPREACDYEVTLECFSEAFDSRFGSCNFFDSCTVTIDGLSPQSCSDEY